MPSCLLLSLGVSIPACASAHPHRTPVHPIARLIKGRQCSQTPIRRQNDRRAGAGNTPLWPTSAGRRRASRSPIAHSVLWRAGLQGARPSNTRSRSSSAQLRRGPQGWESAPDQLTELVSLLFQVRLACVSCPLVGFAPCTAQEPSGPFSCVSCRPHDPL